MATPRQSFRMEKQPERIQLKVEAVTELQHYSDLDGDIKDRLNVRSVEELISDVDQKLMVCFGPIDEETERIDGVNPLTEGSVFKNDEIRNALMDNYGNVTPVDWSQSQTRLLHLPVLHIQEKAAVDDRVDDLDMSDDEELRDQMDLHSIIVSYVNNEPFVTAEQVIEEIEQMMQDSPDVQAEQNSIRSKLIHRSTGYSGFEERMRNLTIEKLNELLEEVETAIRLHSEKLVCHLDLRDELKFEKEVMNSFISVLIEVQNLQKEYKELMKKKRKEKSGVGEQRRRLQRLSASRFSMERISTAIQNGFRQTFRHTGGEKQYLTTVIPYQKKDAPPSVEDLQVFTKILQAMKDDSDKVPRLLTDYILKVLCPPNRKDIC